jgi:uncharacterized protein (DUF1697 family)
MPTWIALFRAINVGGKNMLPMAKLKVGLESLKLTQVRTYIQSGNVVFQAASKSRSALAKKIMDMVEAEHGFRPQLLLLTADELAAAIEANPYPDATAEPTSLHFFFLAEPASAAKTAGLDKLKTESESYQLTDQVLYLRAPDGIGRSKLAAGAEKQLKVTTTARNYRTVEKLLAMTRE